MNKDMDVLLEKNEDMKKDSSLFCINKLAILENKYPIYDTDLDEEFDAIRSIN